VIKADRKFSVMQINGITCTDTPALNHIAIRICTPTHDRRLQNDLIDDDTCDSQPEDLIKAVRNFSVMQINGITCTDTPDVNHIAIRTSTPMHDRRLQNDLIDDATSDPQPDRMNKAVRKFFVMQFKGIMCTDTPDVNHIAIRMCPPTYDSRLQNDLNR
jgi:hypothetical protein